MCPASHSGQKRGEATRADILNVARRLVSEHGYHHTSLSDIQEATGLTKGAFYHHFRSKEDLALAILETAGGEYAERLIGPAMEAPTPGQRIEALLDRAAALNGDPEWCNCQMMATLFAELTSADGRLRDAVQAMAGQFHEMWRDLIAEASRSGELRQPLDPDAAAQWVTSSMTGAMLARKLGTARVPPEKLVALIKQTLLDLSPNDKSVSRASRRK